MTERLRGLSMRPPATKDEAVTLAQSYYTEGMCWLVRLEAADHAESRIRCATAASAFFDAGRLALALGEEVQP